MSAVRTAGRVAAVLFALVALVEADLKVGPYTVSPSAVGPYVQQPLAQGRGGAAQAPRAPRAAAPFDITGNWVSVVTEDWRWRMVVPKKGDYSSVPLNAAGRKAADAWDPARIAEDGCKPYGAAAVMRVPGRLRISWENGITLRIDTDAGLQTRRLYFDASRPAPTERSWQGHSIAAWDLIRNPGGLGVSLQTAPPRVGALKVVTRNLRAGKWFD